MRVAACMVRDVRRRDIRPTLWVVKPLGGLSVGNWSTIKVSSSIGRLSNGDCPAGYLLLLPSFLVTSKPPSMSGSLFSHLLTPGSHLPLIPKALRSSQLLLAILPRIEISFQPLNPSQGQTEPQRLHGLSSVLPISLLSRTETPKEVSSTASSEPTCLRK